MYLQKLLDISLTAGKIEPFPCLQDLLRNGLSAERFAADESRPNRSTITLFIAGLCKRMGLDAESYRDWLINYSIDVLSKISGSTAAAIRHSTKSVIGFTHRTDVPFCCDVQHNNCKATCSPTCPLYEEMSALRLANLEREREKAAGGGQMRLRQEPIPIEQLQVTKRYRKQYDEALELLPELIAAGHTRREIAATLNQKGYKTITGRDWNIRIVQNAVCMQGLVKK